VRTPERRPNVGVPPTATLLVPRTPQGHRASTVEERRGDKTRGEVVLRERYELRVCVPTRKRVRA